MATVCGNGHANIDGAFFCDQCGVALAPVGGDALVVRLCPRCGSPNQASDDRCAYCDTPLAGSRDQRDTKKIEQLRPRIVVIADGATFDLDGKTEFVIGRADPTCDLFPDIDLTTHGGEEGGVSRVHARLRRDFGAWMVEDQKSVNFTFLNKQRLEPYTPTPIKAGDELRLGRVVLRFEVLL